MLNIELIDMAGNHLFVCVCVCVCVCINQSPEANSVTKL